MKACTIEGCERKHNARGWCMSHYMRWLRYGDPIAGNTYRIQGTSLDRFWSKVNKYGPVPAQSAHLGPCWQWTDAPNDNGYGLFSFGGRTVRAHRFSWELSGQEIPGHMLIDHRCRNKLCIRPEHLRLVTKKQNAEHVDAYAKNSSGYRGVSFSKKRKKWKVQVMHNGRNHVGGFFDDVHEAGRAARDLRNKLFTHNDLDRRAA